MKLYTFNEGTLSIAENWKDETMNVFTFPDETGGNLVINRTQLPTGIEINEYYQQVLEQFRRNLKKYRETDYQLITLDDQPAHLLDYEWQTPEGKIYQLTVLQVRHPQLLTFTYTASQPFSVAQKSHLLNILFSFKANT